MLGIDIVDIKDPSFQERNDRSFDLITHEQDTVLEHPQAFWLLWSAKEAVFKCKREPLNFSPKKIPIQIVEDGDNFSFRSENIEGFFAITDEYILCICGDLSSITYEVFDDSNEYWNEGIRFLIIEYFREKGLDYHIGSDDLNLPIIEPSKQLITISHHGRFGVFAYPKSLLS